VQLSFNLQLDRYKIHDIDIVIDQFEVKDSAMQRLTNSLRLGLLHGQGTIVVLNPATGEARDLSRHLICPTSGISYQEPEPNTFSFNSPYGACPKCSGLGYITEMDLEKIIPDRKRSINEGGIAPLGSAKSSSMFKQLNALAEKLNFSLNDPIAELGDEILDVILYGTNEPIYIKSEYTGLSPQKVNFEGIINFMNNFDFDSAPASLKKWINQFINETECPVCQGARLKKESLCFKIGDKSISDLARMDISELAEWMTTCNSYFNEKQQIIAHEILREITMRIQFLTDVGISYLSLNRSAKSLAGGEAQRIRLATQISSQLVNVLYILDEPSIGLHQRDNRRLIESLQHLRDAENSIIVVEHDEDMMRAADFVVDVGPFAGEHGGEIVAQGTFDEILKSNSLTADYLTGKKQILVPKTRREGNGKSITLLNCTGNNLKNVDVVFPLGKFICVTGVSGSGKSTLINETLYPILNHHIYRSEKKPLPYGKITGLDHIDKVIEINQQPIGKTPRSNPATYIGVFDDIRQLFAQLPESKIRGYKPGRFSFNVTGGRCEECGGAGVKAIEMNFLPDVYVTCDKCNGKRYNAETLEVRYKGKSIYDVLEMDIDTALAFFEGIPFIVQKLHTIAEVGLGYIRLGQPSTTLSGGEAQRVKLAAELSKKDTGTTFYILDEPTTGLHFQDIAILLDLLNRFVEKGNTVLVIEHNMEVIKMADHIIDMGPEGGRFGGEIIATGTPEEIVKQQEGFTWEYLKFKV
jgi:excinuclease ABC subunit A